MSRSKKPRQYSDRQFIDAVQNSYSFAEVSRNLGVTQSGNNHKTFKVLAQKLSVDTKHFAERHKHRPNRPKISTENILNNTYPCKSTALKKRLITENYFKDVCDGCEVTEWNGSPITLHLHHVDGNNQNNSLSNLMILCPNCHSQEHRRQTAKPIYGRKKTKEQQEHRESLNSANMYAVYKIDWRKHSAIDIVERHDYVFYKACKEVGISDNGLKKRFNIEMEAIKWVL